ncbi:MAG: phosphoesterase, partial [Cytophagaceae bacterium]
MLNRLLLAGLFLALTLPSTAQKRAHRHASDKRTLADQRSDGFPLAMPYNRLIDAAGTAVFFGDPKLENHALDLTPLPGGNQLVIEDRYGIAVFDRATQKITYRWSLSDAGVTKGLMSTFSGLEAFVVNGQTYLAWGASERENGKSGVVIAAWTNGKVANVELLAFAPVAPSPLSLPNDVAARMENGEWFLYVALNGNNQLVKVRFSDRSTVWTAPTGVAPYGLALTGDRAFVTNWAGPLPSNVPDSTGKTETAGVPWGQAYIDPKTGAIARGSVSVIDLATGRVDNEIPVGLHPNAILPSPDKKRLYVANGNSDYISVIDAGTR